MSGILVGVTEGGVTTLARNMGAATERAQRTTKPKTSKPKPPKSPGYLPLHRVSRVRTYLSALRETHGDYSRVIQAVPEVGRIMEVAGVAYSGGFAHHFIPPDHFYRLLSVCDGPSEIALREAMKVERIGPPRMADKRFKKYRLGAILATRKVREMLDKEEVRTSSVDLQASPGRQPNER